MPTDTFTFSEALSDEFTFEEAPTMQPGKLVAAVVHHAPDAFSAIHQLGKYLGVDPEEMPA